MSGAVVLAVVLVVSATALVAICIIALFSPWQPRVGPFCQCRHAYCMHSKSGACMAYSTTWIRPTCACSRYVGAAPDGSITTQPEGKEG